MQSKKKNDQQSDLFTKLSGASPWIALGLNVAAAFVGLVTYYKSKADEVFMQPYTHVHYMGADNQYICGDRYVNKKHVCDGRFLNVCATMPSLQDFLNLGLTKEQWDESRNIINSFNNGSKNEQGC